jgi:transposase-like protein
MVLEHQGDYASQWVAIGSIASKIGCTGETLRRWVRGLIVVPETHWD